MSETKERSMESSCSQQLWLYGAGIVANQFLDYVQKGIFSVELAGILVSSKEGNPDSLGGYPVIVLADFEGTHEADERDRIQIVLTVAYKKQHEVASLLLAKGYSNLVYWKQKNRGVSWRFAEYHFEDRRQQWEMVCFVLGGYKEFLWKDVEQRLCRFLPENVEVCLLSSGIYSKTLAASAEQHGWSYLSTTRNCVTLIQNLAMEFYPQAKYIYKMDEDIFLTEGCFERIMDAFLQASLVEPLKIGVAAPLINVNGYGYLRILQKLGLVDDYEERFERPLLGGDPEKQIESNVATAAYMWGVTGQLPPLDQLNKIFHSSQTSVPQTAQKPDYRLCNVRFSIGFILFSREFWDAMGGFEVSEHADMGADEEKICASCMIKNFGLAVAENCVVGHFSFGKQTDGMKEYYRSNPSYFKVVK